LIDSDDHDDGNVSETEPIQQPSRPQRKHKQSKPNHYLKAPGHRPKGSRSGRRYENSKLVPIENHCFCLFYCIVNRKTSGVTFPEL